jgi:16S rRNA (guanine966-N2)-methyltransferase
VRIIAGRHRGTHLAEVGTGDGAAHLRPTSDRVRENLFNMLQGGRFGAGVQGAQVLDLFAGTGALGLEALSRGAIHLTLVDNGKVAQALIRANIAKLKRAADCTLLTCDVAALPAAPAPCTVVFLDPPYGRDLGRAALDRAQTQGWIAPGAIVIWEEDTAQPAPAGFTQIESRRYGATTVTFLQASS